MAPRADLIDVPEHRALPVSDFEFRTEGDTLSLDGYASVFDSPYDIWGGPAAGGWSEIVDKRAFDVTLRENPDLNLLINHEGTPLARTKSGTLTLTTDKTGLRVSAPSLDLRNPDVQRLRSAMERGDMDEMSFAFRVKKQEWSEDDTVRRLTEVSLHKGDVSVVNYGANPATSATLRGLLRKVADLDPAAAAAECRSGALLDVLTDAAARIAEVRRAVTPAEKRVLTLTEALAIAERG